MDPGLSSAFSVGLCCASVSHPAPGSESLLHLGHGTPVPICPPTWSPAACFGHITLIRAAWSMPPPRSCSHTF